MYVRVFTYMRIYSHAYVRTYSHTCVCIRITYVRVYYLWYGEFVHVLCDFCFSEPKDRHTHTETHSHSHTRVCHTCHTYPPKWFSELQSLPYVFLSKTRCFLPLHLFLVWCVDSWHNFRLKACLVCCCQISDGLGWDKKYGPNRRRIDCDSVQVISNDSVPVAGSRDTDHNKRKLKSCSHFFHPLFCFFETRGDTITPTSRKDTAPCLRSGACTHTCDVPAPTQFWGRSNSLMTIHSN